MKKVLGLDVSSTTIGWGLLGIKDHNIVILEHGNIKPPKKNNFSIVERLYIVSKEIELLCQRLMPDYIVIEDLLQYMKNKTSANTIITLAVFNRAVALQTYKTTNKLPLFLLPISVRTCIKKFLKMQVKIEKEQIPDILQNYFGKTFFKIVGYKKQGKNKGQPIIEVFDEADACAAAWAGIIKLNLLEEKDEKLL